MLVHGVNSPGRRAFPASLPTQHSVLGSSLSKIQGRDCCDPLTCHLVHGSLYPLSGVGATAIRTKPRERPLSSTKRERPFFTLLVLVRTYEEAIQRMIAPLLLATSHSFLNTEPAPESNPHEPFAVTSIETDHKWFALPAASKVPFRPRPCEPPFLLSVFGLTGSILAQIEKSCKYFLLSLTPDK